uniref:Ig-like domain-containing protein n=1 Tax=Oreochromis niloticus TaxID=8128 RepID=A0A669BYV6_ORENI
PAVRLLLALSVCLGVEVRQSPSEFITKAGSKVEIFCSHEKTDYRMMLWYQQLPGETAMKLIGYLSYKDPKFEEQYDDFNITGDLSVNTVKKRLSDCSSRKTRNDTGVYFCAVSKHSDVRSRRSCTKTAQQLI